MPRTVRGVCKLSGSRHFASCTFAVLIFRRELAILRDLHGHLILRNGSSDACSDTHGLQLIALPQTVNRLKRAEFLSLPQEVGDAETLLHAGLVGLFCVWPET